MNEVCIKGRLTADPELRQTQNGISNCRFTVAVNKKKKKDEEPSADFISCVAWRQTAEFICRYFTKGQEIILKGRLSSGSYQDRKHPDVTHYTQDVVVDNAEFCGSKQNNQTPQNPPAPAPYQNQPAPPRQQYVPPQGYQNQPPPQQAYNQQPQYYQQQFDYSGPNYDGNPYGNY